MLFREHEKESSGGCGNDSNRDDDPLLCSQSSSILANALCSASSRLRLSSAYSSRIDLVNTGGGGCMTLPCLDWLSCCCDEATLARIYRSNRLCGSINVSKSRSMSKLRFSFSRIARQHSTLAPSIGCASVLKNVKPVSMMHSP